MGNVAIVYWSRMGQTEKIVACMQREFESQGCFVKTWNLREVSPDVGTEIDAVIYGGPIYRQRFPQALTKWVSRNHETLREKKKAFFSVSLNAADSADNDCSLVTAEMRIHSTSHDARKKFAIYWTLLGPGIHLYMRSILRALKRLGEKKVITQKARNKIIHPASGTTQMKIVPTRGARPEKSCLHL